MTLAELEKGESRTVLSVRGESLVTRRLMEMGVIPGVAVRMVKSAPFGDPLEINVRGYSLALGATKHSRSNSNRLRTMNERERK